VTDTPESAYDRGRIDGQVAAQLADHAKHFAAINGSIADVARELATLTLAVQRLGDEARAREATVKTTADALEAARKARADTADSNWTPFQRALAVVAAAAAAVGVWLGFIRKH
jgi:hypothetical protein